MDQHDWRPFTMSNNASTCAAFKVGGMIGSNGNCLRSRLVSFPIVLVSCLDASKLIAFHELRS